MTKRKHDKQQTITQSKQDTVKHLELQHIKGNFYNKVSLNRFIPASIVILALSFVLYHSCLPFGYVLDDTMVITENTFTKKGFGGIWDILTTESFTGYFGEKKELVQGNRYRPLSIITFAIEYGIVGDMNPKLSHFINILLYSLTGIIFMMVLSMLFRNFSTHKWWFSIPFLAAVFFISHPVHTEAVANIKGRDEIMSMLFSLSALYAGLRYMDNSAWKWLVSAIVCYFLGLLSKENAITFLAVIPLSVYFFSETNWSRLRTLMLWLLLGTVLYLILRFNTAGVPKFGQKINDLMNNPFLGMTAAEKFGSIMYTLGKYVMLQFWPHPLSHDYYPYAIPKISIFKFIPLLSLAGYIFLLVAGFKGWVKKSVYSYTILYYLVTLTIVSNIVINLGTFMNERFIFMASAGFCIALAYFLSEQMVHIKKFGKPLALVLALIILSGFSIKTYLRVPVWKDALSLNQAAVDVSSNSARANSFMSTALFERYKTIYETNEKKELLNKAEIYGQKAVNILPDYQNGNLMLIGVASERYKMDNDINRYCQQMKPIILRRPDIPFIKEFSDYLKGRGHDRELFPFYLEVGNELLKFRDQRRDWSIRYLMYAYEINPNSKAVNEALALAYELAGNINESIRYKTAAESMQ